MLQEHQLNWSFSWLHFNNFGLLFLKVQICAEANMSTLYLKPWLLYMTLTKYFFTITGQEESFYEISRQCSYDEGTVLNIDKTFNLTKTHKITICSYRQRNFTRRKYPQRNPLLVSCSFFFVLQSHKLNK